MKNLIFLIAPFLFLAAAGANGEEKQAAAPSSGQLLVVAAFELDVDKVKELIAKSADVDARMGDHPNDLFKDKWTLGWPISSPKWTPLLAVAHSHREPPPKKEVKNTSEALREADEEMRKIDPKLLAERDSRRVAIAKLLIAAKARLDLDDGYGNTALAQAVDNDYEELALLLIEAGAKVNTKTGIYIDGPGGVTPLHDAAANPRLVAALLKRGADVKARTTSGDTPLHYAALLAGRDSLRQLLEGPRKKPAKSAKSAPPPPSKSAECVRLLIAAGADVNAKNEDGKTPLDRVRDGEGEEKEVADLLRKAGAK